MAILRRPPVPRKVPADQGSGRASLVSGVAATVVLSEDSDGNPLGEYLRAHRSLMTPERAASPAGSNRRIAQGCDMVAWCRTRFD
jgi:hypothetical protein